jgi:hypothetical protein
MSMPPLGHCARSPRFIVPRSIVFWFVWGNSYRERGGGQVQENAYLCRSIVVVASSLSGMKAVVQRV